MPTGHKIALFGTGSIGMLLYSGTAAVTLSETKAEKVYSEFDILKSIDSTDNSLLVKAYKKVQRKYYPEKDFFVKK